MFLTKRAGSVSDGHQVPWDRVTHTREPGVRRSPLPARFAWLTALIFVVGCGASSAKTDAGKPLTVGFVYIGSRDDFGYNQAHAFGAAAVKKLPGVKESTRRRTSPTRRIAARRCSA